jgi:hypothetical protein
VNAVRSFGRPGTRKIQTILPSATSMQIDTLGQLYLDITAIAKTGKPKYAPALNHRRQLAAASVPFVARSHAQAAASCLEVTSDRGPTNSSDMYTFAACSSCRPAYVCSTYVTSSSTRGRHVIFNTACDIAYTSKLTFQQPLTNS